MVAVYLTDSAGLSTASNYANYTDELAFEKGKCSSALRIIALSRTHGYTIDIIPSIVGARWLKIIRSYVHESHLTFKERLNQLPASSSDW